MESRLTFLLVVLPVVALSVSSTRSVHAIALDYLRKNHPPSDEHFELDVLDRHVRMALEARAVAPEAVPCEIFCDHILPYACLDEPDREDNMRSFLADTCRPMVRHAANAAEAACTLNALLWEALGVRYEPNLSPAYLSPREVMEHGAASCSGLSLLLVHSCRACGVAARCAAVADWGDGSGNHCWVEVYSGGRWHYLGAAEPSALNDTWFAHRLHAPGGPPVLASTFDRSTKPPRRFPLPWQPGDHESWVPAIDVTEHYREAQA